MVTFIGSWNACNGIVNKKDYTKCVLKNEKIDVLCIQEAQISNLNEHGVAIDGYSSEFLRCSPKKEQ